MTKRLFLVWMMCVLVVSAAVNASATTKIRVADPAKKPAAIDAYLLDSAACDSSTSGGAFEIPYPREPGCDVFCGYEGCENDWGCWLFCSRCFL